MKLSFRSLVTLTLAASCLWIALATRDAQAAAVQVMLFGQPCQLTGPAGLSEAQLNAIHQISPEQTPFSDAPKSIEASIEKLKSSDATPSILAGYLQQRTKALRARLSLELAIEAGRKARSAAPFAQGTQGLIHPKRHAALIKTFEKALKAGNSPHAWEQLRADFAEVAEPDGEEDFHRALRKLKVVYQCSFEDTHAAETGNP